FTSGMTTASTQGTQAGGSVTSTATLNSITNTNGETMVTPSLSATCTANGTNTGSTTFTANVPMQPPVSLVYTDINQVNSTTTTEPIPANPSVNQTFNGTLELSASDTETYTW